MTSTSVDFSVAIYSILGAFFASVLGSFLVYRAQMKRIPSQNTKDGMDAAKIALEIAETSSAQQLKLQREVQELRQIIDNPRHFKVMVTFTVGDTPRIEGATVEEVPDLRSPITVAME